MSNLSEHIAEQDALTAAAADRGDFDPTPAERAQEIIDAAGGGEVNNTARAAMGLLAFLPSYDDDTVKVGLTDLISDLLHLCDLAGFSFAEIEKSARHNYQRELMSMGAAHDAALSKAIAAF